MLTLVLAAALSQGHVYDRSPDSYCSLGGCTFPTGSLVLTLGDITLTAGDLIFGTSGKIETVGDGQFSFLNNGGTAYGIPLFRQVVMRSNTDPGFFIQNQAGNETYFGDDGTPANKRSSGSSDWKYCWSTGTTIISAPDTCLVRSAAGNVATQLTAKGQTTGIAMSTQSLTFANNATKVTSGLVPDGAFLLGITTRVTTAGATCTSVSIGDGTDVDMFGLNTGITQNTTTDNSNATAQFGRSPATSAMEVTITANGGNCTAGVWAVTAHYILPAAATSN